MKIREILAKKGSEVFDIYTEDTVEKALQEMVENNIGALIVRDSNNSEIQGIISERDLLRLFEKKWDNMYNIPVSDIMTKNIIVGNIDDDLSLAENTMTHNKIRHLPIMDEQGLSGMISIGDLVKAKLQEIETQNKYLNDYIYMN
jgi:CBS domain-containing protein